MDLVTLLVALLAVAAACALGYKQLREARDDVGRLRSTIQAVEGRVASETSDRAALAKTVDQVRSQVSTETEHTGAVVTALSARAAEGDARAEAADKNVALLKSEFTQAQAWNLDMGKAIVDQTQQRIQAAEIARDRADAEAAGVRQTTAAELTALAEAVAAAQAEADKKLEQLEAMLADNRNVLEGMPDKFGTLDDRMQSMSSTMTSMQAQSQPGSPTSP